MLTSPFIEHRLINSDKVYLTSLTISSHVKIEKQEIYT